MTFKIQNGYEREWFFAECSRLAYRPKLRGAKEFRRIGFTTHNFYDVEGAQCHIAKNSDTIIIAFRGTEPKQFSDINADLMRGRKGQEQRTSSCWVQRGSR